MKLKRTYPANTTVLRLENHKGERGSVCSVDGCRNVWFAGEEDVRWFEHIGAVCGVHAYLIPRMTLNEIKDKEIGYSGYWCEIFHNMKKM